MTTLCSKKSVTCPMKSHLSCYIQTGLFTSGNTLQNSNQPTFLFLICPSCRLQKSFFLIILRLELNDPQSGREAQVERDNLWGDRSCYTLSFERHLNIVFDYLTVNMRATGSFQISVTVYRSAWRNTQKELHLENSEMKADTRQKQEHLCVFTLPAFCFGVIST